MVQSAGEMVGSAGEIGLAWLACPWGSPELRIELGIWHLLSPDFQPCVSVLCQYGSISTVQASLYL